MKARRIKIKRLPIVDQALEIAREFPEGSEERAATLRIAAKIIQFYSMPSFIVAPEAPEQR